MALKGVQFTTVPKYDSWEALTEENAYKICIQIKIQIQIVYLYSPQ